MGDDSRWRDWANNAVGKIKQQRDDQRLKDQVFVAENDLKKQQAPLVWAQIRSDMKGMCDALNAHADTELLAWDSARTNEAILRILAASTTGKASFDPERARIVFEIGPETDIYDADVIGGMVVFRDGSVPRQPHEIAKRFLDSIVKWIR